MAKTRVPAVEGLFTMDEGDPHLIAGRAPNGSYFFPKDLGGSDPYSPLGPIEEVLLSNRGRIWSYTDSRYTPPLPFIPRTEPFVPVVIAAVELPAEKMVVLGQVVDGVTTDDLEVGMEVEMVLGTLYEDDEHDYVVWKWKPVDGAAARGQGLSGPRQSEEFG
jgi:uncharacterized OB-fold protein